MLLKPGLFARVQATVGVQNNALVVPLDAVITIQNLHQLAVVGPDNKVSIRNVNVSFMTRQEAVITSGVSAGEKIVVQGIQKVTDGCSVMPLPVAPPSSATPGPTIQEQMTSKNIPSAAGRNPQSSAGGAAKQ
jgi:membrane fusion protein (multidrug efflux system)